MRSIKIAPALRDETKSAGGDKCRQRPVIEVPEMLGVVELPVLPQCLGKEAVQVGDFDHQMTACREQITQALQISPRIIQMFEHMVERDDLDHAVFFERPDVRDGPLLHIEPERSRMTDAGITGVHTKAPRVSVVVEHLEKEPVPGSHIAGVIERDERTDLAKAVEDIAFTPPNLLLGRTYIQITVVTLGENFFFQPQESARRTPQHCHAADAAGRSLRMADKTGVLHVTRIPQSVTICAVLHSFLALRHQHPYNTLRGFFWYLQFLTLFAAPRWTFQAMSIVPLVMRAYRLESRKEFLVRYYASRIGFEQQWATKTRDTPESIASFYQEHDKDIWRQAYLSDRKFNYKKKILKIWHLIRAEDLPPESPILDYGGGAGAVVHYLTQKGFTRVDIADIPSSTIEFVRKQMSGFLRNVIVLDAAGTLPARDYAVIICVDVLEHTPQPLVIVKNFLESLRLGGLLILNFPKETDFSGAHLESAQKDRDAVFAMLRERCDVLVPMSAYRKN